MEECGLPVMENSRKFAITKDTRRVQDASRLNKGRVSASDLSRSQNKRLEDELIETKGVTM